MMPQRRHPKGSSKGGEFAPGPVAERPEGSRPPTLEEFQGSAVKLMGLSEDQAAAVYLHVAAADSEDIGVVLEDLADREGI